MRGLFFNELADDYAKAGSTADQNEVTITMGAVASTIKRHATSEWEKTIRQDWHYEIFGTSNPDAPEGPPQIRTIVHQLRTGHYSKCSAYKHRIGQRPNRGGCNGCVSVGCPGAKCEYCGSDAGTAQHVLMNCPASERLRHEFAVEKATDLKSTGYLTRMARWLHGWPDRPPP